jgi:glycogen operon protein
VFRRSTFFAGRGEGKLPDVWWFRPDGRKMTRNDWESAPPQLAVFLNGAELGERDAHGEPVMDDSFLILFNAHHEAVEFLLPSKRFGMNWLLDLSTAEPAPEPARYHCRGAISVESRSLVVLRRDG